LTIVLPMAARIATAAILASADIDAERFRLYFDLILISLRQNAPAAFEATMNSRPPLLRTRQGRRTNRDDPQAVGGAFWTAD